MSELSEVEKYHTLAKYIWNPDFIEISEYYIVP